jgi:hypothetical protein
MIRTLRSSSTAVIFLLAGAALFSIASAGGQPVYNLDESAANPFPDYPEILKLKDGQMGWSERRPEIIGDFERESADVGPL